MVVISQEWGGGGGGIEPSHMHISYHQYTLILLKSFILVDVNMKVLKKISDGKAC